MKKIISLLLVCLVACSDNINAAPISTILETNTATSLEDGWYKSTVKYTNYNTANFATYRLNVKVDYDKITVISFGNGGSVHSGYNNEGYIYSGGYIDEEKDYYGRIIAYTAKVTVTDGNGMRVFNIRIE